jgi:hypothetical protein
VLPAEGHQASASGAVCGANLPVGVGGLRRRVLQPHEWPRVPADADVSVSRAGSAQAGRVQHPPSVCLREDRVIGQVEQWLTHELAQLRMSQAVSARADAGPGSGCPGQSRTGTAAGNAGRGPELTRPVTRASRARAGAPGARAGRAGHEAGLRQPGRTRDHVTGQECTALPAGLAGATPGAAADGKSEVFRQVGLKLTYHPGRRVVEASIEPALPGFSAVSGQVDAGSPLLLTTECALGGGSGRSLQAGASAVGPRKGAPAACSHACACCCTADPRRLPAWCLRRSSVAAPPRRGNGRLPRAKTSTAVELAGQPVHRARDWMSRQVPARRTPVRDRRHAPGCLRARPGRAADRLTARSVPLSRRL